MLNKPIIQPLTCCLRSLQYPLSNPLAKVLSLPPGRTPAFYEFLLALPSGLAAHWQTNDLHLCSHHLSKHCSYRPMTWSQLKPLNNSRWQPLDASSPSELLQAKRDRYPKTLTWGLWTPHSRCSTDHVRSCLFYCLVICPTLLWSTQEQGSNLTRFPISCIQ